MEEQLFRYVRETGNLNRDLQVLPFLRSEEMKMAIGRLVNGGGQRDVIELRRLKGHFVYRNN